MANHMKFTGMVRMAAVAVALSVATTAFAGTDVSDDKPVEKVYTIAMVARKPMFPGGEAEMYKWLGEHMKYPAQAQEDGVQGRVLVEFNIKSDGSISNVKIARGIHPALDKEAVRLVKSMPQWTPGLNSEGVAVTVSYTLPITFKLH